MRRTRTTEIIIETDEILAVRGYASPALYRCDHCGAEVEMVSAERAAAVMGASARMIYRLLEGGEIHFQEDETGVPLICLNLLPLISELIDNWQSSLSCKSTPRLLERGGANSQPSDPVDPQTQD
jgi:hypothetical protein